MSERIEFFEGDVVEFVGHHYTVQRSINCYDSDSYPIQVADVFFTKDGRLHVDHTKPFLALIRRGPNYKPPKKTKTIEFFEAVWLYDDGHAEIYWMSEKGISVMEHPTCKIIKTGQTRTVEIEVKND